MASRRRAGLGMEEALTEDDSQTVPSRPVTTMVVSAACGLVFGFAIEKGKGKMEYKNNSSCCISDDMETIHGGHRCYLKMKQKVNMYIVNIVYAMWFFLYVKMTRLLVHRIQCVSVEIDLWVVVRCIISISVYEPAVVKNQMLLVQFVMMKMFLSGVISGR